MYNQPYKYLALAHKLRRHIAVAGLQPGDRLPTEDELVQEHRLSRVTVRRALKMLEKDGLVSRRRKLGTFVNRIIAHPLDLHLVRGDVVVAISTENAGGTAGVAPGPQEDHALAAVLRSLERYLSDRGFTVQIMGLGQDPHQDRTRLARAIQRGGLEGICAIGPAIDHYRDMVRTVPLVNSCTFSPNATPWVGINMEDATSASVGHLLERGHTRIAMICGPWIDSEGFASFACGYRRAFDDRGIPFNRAMLYHAYQGEPLVELATQILQSREASNVMREDTFHASRFTGLESRPTAVFAEDWRITGAILQAADRLHLDIPGDLSLVGCGQNTLYLASSVGITAYVPDNEQVGREIGRVLTEIIDTGRQPAEPLFVPGRLIERGSVRSLTSPDVGSGQ